MNAQQIQEDMRKRLYAAGLKPTDAGERSARREQKKMRRQICEAVEKLEPRDLFCVWMVVTELEPV